MTAKSYVIGDIHGALKALDQIIKLIQPDENSRLIFLGDYVDGLPESAQVIDYLMKLDDRFSCIFLKGNHDIWLQRWLEQGYADPVWLGNDGRSTLKSYENYSQSDKEKHLDFLRNLRNFYVDEGQNLFVHAGFTSQRGPDNELHGEYLFNDRTLLETAMIFRGSGHFQTDHFPMRLSLFNEIFIGHTPTLKFGYSEPIHAANVWAVDTGIKKNGKLSAIQVKTKQFWQSDLGSDLYPEK